MPNGKFDPPATRTHKPCGRCHVRLPLESFYRNSRMPDGRHGYCTTCCKALKRARYRVLKVIDPERAARRGVITEAERERISKSRQTKVCSGCKERKLIRHFSAKPGGRHGVAGRCKACKVADTAAWRRRVRGR